jgi:hypothetical protein
MIVIEDVLRVAQNLDLPITLDQAREVIDMYPAEQENDPTATWDLVVENCLYNLLND